DRLMRAIGLPAQDFRGAGILIFGDVHHFAGQLLPGPDPVAHGSASAGRPWVASMALVQADSPVSSRPSQGGSAGSSASDVISISASTRPASAPSNTSTSQSWPLKLTI